MAYVPPYIYIYRTSLNLYIPDSVSLANYIPTRGGSMLNAEIEENGTFSLDFNYVLRYFCHLLFSELFKGQVHFQFTTSWS